MFYRFLLASVLIFAYCLARRLPLRYPLREHAWIALFGVLMFSTSYIFVYYAEEHVVSGLVAVGYSASPLLGAIYTAIAVILSAFGAMAAHRNQDAHLPLWQSMAWGMLYGAIFSLVVTVATGKALAFEATAPYILSLLYLAILGSIIAFAGYLTLLKRIGAARSGYIGVMVPIVALVVSAAFEGFRWQALTWVGIAVSVAGNVIILKGK